ncbi:MAG: hypothetical protein KHX03_02395 [Clostridium sp.]|nr:hypothetical protein [Clostridium sp.]
MSIQAMKPLAVNAVRRVKEKGSAVASHNIAEAFKQLFQEFKKVPEIGKFREIKVKVHEPLQNCSINDSFLILKPLADKNDFRTRVLSYMSVSPIDNAVTREVGYISGNKFAMDSALKDKVRINEFKSFLKDSEVFFDSLQR